MIEGVTYPAHRRDPRHKALAHVTLDMVLGSITHTAHTHDAALTSCESRFSREVLGAVAGNSDGVGRDTRIVFGVVGR